MVRVNRVCATFSSNCVHMYGVQGDNSTRSAGGMRSWQPAEPSATAPNNLVEGEADVQQADVVQCNVQCLRPCLTGQERAAAGQ